MPVYPYECTDCHHAWELEQRITDEPATECPSCHQETAKRLIAGNTGFVLKGLVGPGAGTRNGMRRCTTSTTDRGRRCNDKKVYAE